MAQRVREPLVRGACHGDPLSQRTRVTAMTGTQVAQWLEPSVKGTCHGDSSAHHAGKGGDQEAEQAMSLPSAVRFVKGNHQQF